MSVLSADATCFGGILDSVLSPLTLIPAKSYKIVFATFYISIDMPSRFIVLDPLYPPTKSRLWRGANNGRVLQTEAGDRGACRHRREVLSIT